MLQNEDSYNIYPRVRILDLKDQSSIRWLLKHNRDLLFLTLQLRNRTLVKHFSLDKGIEMAKVQGRRRGVLTINSTGDKGHINSGQNSGSVGRPITKPVRG